MASPGLALVGFMSRDHAVHYLANECVPANPNPSALEAEWDAALGSLGPAPANAGQPVISEIPASHQAYVGQLVASPEWANVFHTNPNWEIKLVEIAPLLAYQFAVLDGAAIAHGNGWSGTPTLDELLITCLPLSPVPESFSVLQQGTAALIRARSLNVRPVNFWQSGPGIFSLQVGVALPFVHVVRFGGRCFLHNGYHRAYAALKAGATEIPCVFRDVATPEEIGLGGGTFPLDLLMSDNPPTLNHFASGQAHPVDLVVKIREVHLSWTDWVAPEI